MASDWEKYKREEVETALSKMTQAQLIVVAELMQMGDALIYRTCASAPARPRQRLAGGEGATRGSAY